MPARIHPIRMPTVLEDQESCEMSLYPKTGIGMRNEINLLRNYRGHNPKVKPITLLSRWEIRRLSSKKISSLGIEAIQSIFFQLKPNQVASINPVVLRTIVYKLNPAQIQALTYDQLELVIDVLPSNKIQFLTSGQISYIFPFMSRAQKRSLSQNQKASLSFWRICSYCL